MKRKALALSPVIVPQALWTAARASRLPEAAGDRAGVRGTGQRKSLLILGDSSAAGVGVTHQSDALAGHLATELARAFTIHWRLVARSGETVKRARRAVASLPSEETDFVLIALGVNDVKNGVSARNWAGGYASLLEEIAAKFGPGIICVSGVPHLRDFPILPRPLNAVLGDRSKLFDTLL
ncbi:MAG: SGNH/GDSL hydrolase family protein, partial [Pseudomonadota bacterium]